MRSPRKQRKKPTPRRKTAKPPRARRPAPWKRKPPARAAKSARKTAAAWPPVEERTAYFDLLDLLRRVLMAQDMLLLSRQVSYHVAASEGLPKVFADGDQVALAFSMLLERIVRRAPRGSRIFINLKDFSLRGGMGVEVSISGSDREFGHGDDSFVLNALFDSSQGEGEGASLAQCRQLIVRQHGQMWADVPKQHQPTYHIVLSASEEASRAPAGDHQTFKYDISISNYAMVRKRFGIKKSQHLVEQIELYIRSLVRYPIDMVMAMSDKGIITTIYETQQGAAESVASRISQRLGREEFRIGRKPVELAFRYHLAPLSPETSRAGGSPAARTERSR